jgi:hypothetical protein
MKNRVILLLVGVALAGPSFAQRVGPPTAQKPAAPVAQTVTPQILQQVRQDLRSPDPDVRLATMARVFDSGSKAEQEVAISEGLATADGAMANLATRFVFGQLTFFVPEPVGELRGAALIAYQNRDLQDRNGMRYERKYYDIASGNFFTNDPNGSDQPLRGQISADRLQFRSWFCNSSMTRVQGTWTYQGRVSCKYNEYALNEMMTISIR